MVLQLRQLLRQAKARTAAKQQEVDSLAAQVPTLIHPPTDPLSTPNP